MLQACVYLGAITPYHGNVVLSPDELRRVQTQTRERKALKKMRS